MKHVLLTLMAILISSALVMGCSGGKTPLTPGGGAEKNQLLSQLGEIDPESHLSSGVLGVFSGTIDPISLTGELVPLRKVLSQDVLEVVDITYFLSLAPCSNCVKIRTIYLDSDGNITADIGIIHPFPAGDVLKPPTGRNRLDLHVFNVEGIVAMKSGNSVSFPGLNEVADTMTLLNASGYTGYLDDALDTIMETEASIHPYILHFRDYSAGNYDPMNPNGFADILHPTGNLVMPMGSDVDIRPYTFGLTGTDSIEFTLAVGCTYGISANNKSQRLNPVYLVPQFNKKAASEVAVEIASNDLTPGDPLSSAVIRVKVLDMNQGATVGAALNEMRAESNVASIAIEIPGVTASPVVVSNPTAISGDPKDPANPLTYEITVHNDASGPMGMCHGLVKVTDSYPPALNEAPTLTGMDGINRVDPLTSPLTATFSISEFATYQTFSIEVGGNVPPIADLDVSSQTIEQGCAIDLYPGPNTRDPDGAIVLYEYDFNYDGTNFTVDASNTTGDAVSTEMNTPGNVTVAMRVTDDGIPPMSDIDSLVINVTAYSLSVFFVNQPTQMTQMIWAFNWGTFHDPALCLEDDNHIACTAIEWDYAGLGSNNDCKSTCYSSNGTTWSHDGTSIGTTWRLGTPIKSAADKGDTDSYSYFGWNNGGSTNGAFICKGNYPYEYSWFSAPFAHRCELYGSKASGYIYAIGDHNDNIEVRRCTVQHVVQDSWDLVSLDVTDTDPWLSFIRSIDEDSTGLMFLAYFNTNRNSIKRVKSDDAMGTTWTEGTIWDGSTGTYANVMDPGVDIGIDDVIRVSFIRQDTSTSEYQVCYTYSTDGGNTFTTPNVVASSASQLFHTPIVHRMIGCHSVVAIPYSENGDIKLAISWSNGREFTSGIIVSDFPEDEANPDLILDQNGDMIFAWELADATYNGSIYSRKAQFVVN